MVDDRPLAIGFRAAGYELAEFQHLTQVVHVGRVAAHGLEAVLERRVEAREAELTRGRILSQRGDGEDVEPVQLVDEEGDGGDVGRRGPALCAGERIDHVGGRTAGDKRRAVVRDGVVEAGVAPAKGETGRARLHVKVYDGGGELDEAVVVD